VRDPKHVLGDLCEAIAVKELTARGYWVFVPLSLQCPVDIIAATPGGELMLLDCKADKFRTNPNRKTPSRIHRVLSPQQKQLGVKICYVNSADETIVIGP
jgi:hypothetical protein